MSSLKNYTLFFFGMLLCILSVNCKFPREVEHCKSGDKKCLLKSLNYILKNLYTGDADVALDTFDPLEIGDLDVLNKGVKSPVDIEIRFKNTKVYGFKDSKAVKVSGFGETANGYHEVILKFPKAILIGDYKMNGKVLVLPIVGGGLSNITFIKLDLKFKINGITNEKNGETYLNIKDLKLETNVDQIIMHFSQLFNGDKVLGDTMNKFLNDNWEEIYNEIRRPMLNALATTIKKFLQKAFSFTPYNQIINISND